MVVVGGGDSAGVHIYIRPWEASAQQSVSRFGLAVRLVSSTEDLGSIPLGLDLLSIQKLWSVHTVFVTLSLTVNETLKRLSFIKDFGSGSAWALLSLPKLWSVETV